MTTNFAHSSLSGLKLHDPFHYIQTSDPGAVGAGKYWLNTTGTPYILKRRNATDDGWVTVGTSGSGVARSGSTTDNHLVVWNGSNADSIKDGGAAPTASPCPYQVYIPHLFPSASSGTVYRDTDTVFSYSRIYTIAQNNYLEYPVLLCAGTWRLDWYYTRYTDRAIVDVTIDGSSVGTFDEYGSSNPNTAAAVTGITVASTGVKLLRFTASTKNGSSSNYVQIFYMMAMTRTGA